MSRLSIAAAALLAVHAAGAQAQAPRAPIVRRPHVGVVVGTARTKFTGGDVSGAESQSGPVAGARVAVPLAGPVGLVAEALFVRKGTRLVSTGGSVDLDIGYAEFPVLVSLALPSAGALTPRLYAGPSVAARVACEYDIATTTQRAAGSCDAQTDALGRGTLLHVQAIDAGAVAGGELSLALGRRHGVSVGARIERGLTRITTGSDARNSAFMVTAAYEFRMR